MVRVTSQLFDEKPGFFGAFFRRPGGEFGGGGGVVGSGLDFEEYAFIGKRKPAVPAVGFDLESVPSRIRSDGVAFNDVAVVVEHDDVEQAAENDGDFPVVGVTVRSEIGFLRGGDAVALNRIFRGFMQVVVGAFPVAFNGSGHHFRNQVVIDPFHNEASCCA